MAKVHILQQPIHVYTCMTDPTRRCLAMINGFSGMIFKGDTPIKAKKAAEEWRREAVRNDKLISAERKAEMLGEATA